MGRENLAPKTCLCVEFDPDFFYLIQSYAERSGLRAVHLPYSADALNTIQNEKPAVICLDGDKPSQCSAWDVLQKLKQDVLVSAIPVVFFSWLNEEKHALQEGADVYVQKSVMYVDFVDGLAMAGVLVEEPGSATKPNDAREKGGVSSPKKE